MRQLAETPGNDLTASHPNSNWVFLGTLHELTKLGPVPIITEVLGYHPSTIERHAIGSASVYSEYVAARPEIG